MALMSRRRLIVRSIRAVLAGSAACTAFPPKPRPGCLLASDAATAPDARPLSVCLVSGSLEYRSDESLAGFQKSVEKRYPVRCSRAFIRTEEDLPGLESLETCDCMVLFTRRLRIAGEQLERVKRYCRSGRPIVAVRTASHALQNWLALDKEVLGGDYQGHYGNEASPRIAVVEPAKAHPVLAGFQPFVSGGSLYKNPKLAPDVTTLLTGTIPGHTEPVAWTRVHRGGRVFYTSLGHPGDFRQTSFVRLLTNALFWTTCRNLPAEQTNSTRG